MQIPVAYKSDCFGISSVLFCYPVKCDFAIFACPVVTLEWLLYTFICCSLTVLSISTDYATGLNGQQGAEEQHEFKAGHTTHIYYVLSTKYFPFLQHAQKRGSLRRGPPKRRTNSEDATETLQQKENETHTHRHTPL